MQDRWFKTLLAIICLVLSIPVFATDYIVFPDGSGCTLENAVKAVATRQAQGTGEHKCKAGSSSDTIYLMSQGQAYYKRYRVAGFSQNEDAAKVANWIRGFEYFDDPGHPTDSYKPSAVYELTQQLEIGKNHNTNLSIELFRGPFDKAGYANAVIKAANNERAIFVYPGSRLTLKSIELDGGDVTGQTPEDLSNGKSPDGGVIYAQGGVSLDEGSLLTGGKARNGGGIFLNGGSGSITLKLTASKINDNEATNNGGGIGMPEVAAAADVANAATVTITAKQFNIFNNSAANKGGGFYLDGKTALLTLSAGTLFGNQAGTSGSAVDLEAGYYQNQTRASLLNNVTVLGNTGSVALQYADLCHWDTGTSSCQYAPPGAFDNTSTWQPNLHNRKDFLFNSIVAGNSSGGCQIDFDSSNTGSSIAEYLQNAYSLTKSTSGCPATEHAMAPGNGTSDVADSVTQTSDPGYVVNPSEPANQADASLLLDKNDVPCSTSNPDQCEPSTYGRKQYFLQGFSPAPFDVNSPAYPTLVNAGAPSSRAGLLCVSTDSRGFSRADRCDAGAIELRIANGATDDIDGVVSGRDTYLDVVKNDLGDESIDCNLVSPCLILPPKTRWAAVDLVFAKGPLTCADKKFDSQEDKVTCVDSNIRSTDKKGFDANVQASPDATHSYPLIKYVADSSFHGSDQFVYSINSMALSGATFAGRNPSARVNLADAPPHHFESKNITDFKSGDVSKWFHGGGVGFWMLAALAMLGLARRQSGESSRHLVKTVLAVALSGFCAVASANTIVVNSTADPYPNVEAAFNDGKCTLREALLTTVDNHPSANRDCLPSPDQYTMKGADTIKLPGGTITLNGPLSIGIGNAVTLEGNGVQDNPTPSAGASYSEYGKTVIDGAGKYRIDAQSSLVLKYLVFKNGKAGQGGAVFTNNSLSLIKVALKNNVATQDGGAVYLNYRSDVTHSLTVANSYFDNNEAKGSSGGGAIALQGRTSNITIRISNSTFDGNKATGTGATGGVVYAVLGNHGALSFVNSVLVDNQASDASIVDLSSAGTSTKLEFLNDTFLNNQGTNPNLFLTNSNTSVSLSHSIVAGSQIECGSQTLDTDSYNLYAPSEPASCGSSSTAMTATVAQVKTALDGGSLSSADGTKSDYVPPMLKLKNPSIMTGFPENPTGKPIIVDRGDSSFSSGVSGASNCRSSDMRGKSRQTKAVPTASSTCDLGAYELQILTAKNSAATTGTSRKGGEEATSRQAHADVLRGAIPSDGTTTKTVNGTPTQVPVTIKGDKIGFKVTSGTGSLVLSPGTGLALNLNELDTTTPGPLTYKDPTSGSTQTIDIEPAELPSVLKNAASTSQLKWVAKKSGDPDCDTDDNCGLLVSITLADVNLAKQNGKTDFVCPSNSTAPIKIPYVVYDTKGNMTTATLTLTMTDLKPHFKNSSITVHGDPDETIKIPLHVTDPDGEITDIRLANSGDPAFAETGGTGNHPSWGYGIKWNGDLDHPVIYYRRANKTQRFNDSFTIQAEDNCGSTASQKIKVVFNKPAMDADGLLGGSLGWGIPFLMLLGLVRRRRSKQNN